MSRAYTDTSSVARAYDAWTNDALLERLWGEHIHLGHYGQPPGRRDFRQAKHDFVHALVRWSGLDQLPAGSKVLDVGCGIGGSSRILAAEYGFEVLGISISPAQIARAQALTPAPLDNRCRFAVMDALDLELADHSFDAVWSVEACPHMADKQRYADELLRMLPAQGRLAVADWNRRDPSAGQMSGLESWVMRQLLDNWAHPEFASIESLQAHLQDSPYSGGINVTTGDWSAETLPSWFDSILEGARRPGAVLSQGWRGIGLGLREVPTLVLMHWAFATGLMRFGVFCGQKPPASSSASNG